MNETELPFPSNYSISFPVGMDLTAEDRFAIYHALNMMRQRTDGILICDKVKLIRENTTYRVKRDVHTSKSIGKECFLARVNKERDKVFKNGCTLLPTEYRVLITIEQE
jgi:hypothetical protein